MDYHDTFDEPSSYKETLIGQALSPVITNVFGRTYNAVQVRASGNCGRGHRSGFMGQRSSVQEPWGSKFKGIGGNRVQVIAARKGGVAVW